MIGPVDGPLPARPLRRRVRVRASGRRFDVRVVVDGLRGVFRRELRFLFSDTTSVDLFFVWNYKSRLHQEYNDLRYPRIYPKTIIMGIGDI